MAHQHLPYYHPELSSMDETRGLMMPYVMQDGAFILRDSFSQPGKLTVTVMHSHSIKHFSLGRHNGMYMLHEQLFDSVKDLIDFYKCHDVPNEEEVMHLRLTYPVQGHPNSNTNRSLGGRSQSVVTMPPQFTRGVSHDHRHSIDSNMPGMRHNSNGSANGAAAAPQPIPAPRDRRDRVSESSNGFSASPGSLSGSPTKQSTPLQLPLNKPKEKSKFSLGNFLKRKSSKGSEAKSPTKSPPKSPTRERGPAPLPVPPPVPEAENHYYSCINSVDVDRHKDLMENIRQSEPAGGYRCECGLTYEEAQLPGGWSMHLSQEPGSTGMIFFMGPNNETDWNLPVQIMLQLSADQQESLRAWMDKGKVQMNRNSSSSSSGAGSCLGMDGGNRQSGSGQVTYGRQATEHECSSDEIFPPHPPYGS